MKTKFGDASLNKGHYRIHSKKEGNYGKYLHRLIFEDFYQIKLPNNIAIHHEDGSPLNNEIWNLVPMTIAEHTAIHHSEKVMIKSENDVGYYRVTKQNCSECKQGFRWRYVYYDSKKEKAITSIHLNDLKEKVLAKGLPWIKLGVAI